MQQKGRTMANQPSIDNVQRWLCVQRELGAKILKKFRVDDSMTIKDAYILALMYAARGIKLDAATTRRLRKTSAPRRTARKEESKMSIVDIKPEDCPAELRARIEKYAKSKNWAWVDAVVSLAREVVSPNG